MTSWIPRPSSSVTSKNRAIFEALRDDIYSGVLRPGESIPPLRVIANALGVNPATVKRAFDSAEQEGLLERHVGKGTFVREDVTDLVRPFQDRTNVLDMATNSPPTVAGQRLQAKLSELASNTIYVNNLFRYQRDDLIHMHRDAISHWIKRHGVSCQSDQLVITPGAQAAVATSVLSCVRPGECIAVEEFTYAGLISACSSLGIEPVVVDSDENGMLPDALEHLVSQNPRIRAVFAIPRVNNPTTRTMSKFRVLELSELAIQNDLKVIEDDSYISEEISDEHPTFVQSIPGHTFYVSGFSKTVQPGLRIGYVVVPQSDSSIAKTISRSLNYSVSPLHLQIVKDWIEDGTAAAIRSENQSYFHKRQRLVSNILAGTLCKADANNAQVWLPLPDGWTSRRFTEAALAEGIRVSPAESFMARNDAPSYEAVRLCVSGITNDDLFAESLTTIAALYDSPPETSNYVP